MTNATQPRLLAMPPEAEKFDLYLTEKQDIRRRITISNPVISPGVTARSQKPLAVIVSAVSANPPERLRLFSLAGIKQTTINK